MTNPVKVKRPNVLWIFGDQHRLQALGTMGDPNVRTPNLDRLASNGFVSTGAVGGYPLCCPCRGSLLSGRYPHHAVRGHEHPFPDGMPTIAQPFNEAGYDTAWFGKWHVDGFKERNGRAAFHTVPKHRRGGFKTWIGYENNNAQWDSWVHGHAEEDEVERYRLPGYETDELTSLLIDYVKGHDSDTPFFAALSVQPPHDPYVAPARFMADYSPASVILRENVPNVPRVLDRARGELAGYCAMVNNLDWNVGRILSTLEELGMQEDTHIIFFSDHGDMLGSHGQFRKTSPWEESIRVPFIISGGSRYNRKCWRSHVPVNHVDLGPTSLGLCGIPKPDWMAGTDYAGLRIAGQDKPEEPDSAFLQLVEPTGHGNSIDRPWRGIVTRDRWKYVCLEGQPWLLFNLNEDPYEFINHAHNPVYHAERKRLQDRLAAWIADTGDTFRLP
jgi:arylsulfatase A-like enzyme